MTVSICWECDYPNELVFFRGVETTNQLMAFKCIDMVCVYIYEYLFGFWNMLINVRDSYGDD